MKLKQHGIVRGDDSPVGHGTPQRPKKTKKVVAAAKKMVKPK